MRTIRGYLLCCVLASISAAALLSACSDDGDPSSTPTPTGPTASPVPTQAPNEAALAAAEAYLTSDGVDGETGEFTEPLNCNDATEDSPGRFCIHDAFTTYAPGLVILRFGEKDDPEAMVWEIRLAPGDDGWQVTSARPFELSE
jgi:hypothetical protein